LPEPIFQVRAKLTSTSRLSTTLTSGERLRFCCVVPAHD
jgi:hypothetical protein